jgi:hypothetical protein
VRAEQPEGAEGVDRLSYSAGAGGFDHGAGGCDRAVAHRRQGVLDRGIGDVNRDPRHALGRLCEHLEHGVGVAAVYRLGQAGDAAAEAVDAVEHDDAVGDRGAGRRIVGRHLVAGRLREGAAGSGADEQVVGRGLDDVAKDCARLDRRELGGVADEDEPGLGPDRALTRLGV